MKKSICLFLCLITINLYSQTREPRPHLFSYKGQQTVLINHPDFQANEILFGWHWGGERRISKVMKVNQSDMTSANKNCLLILQDVGHPQINFPV